MTCAPFPIGQEALRVKNCAFCRRANIRAIGNRCQASVPALQKFAFTREEPSVSSTSPSSRKRSTSSIASKRNLNAPAAPTLRSRPRATATSFEDDSQGPQVFENVWDAIEDDPAVRQRMKILSSLMLEIALLIRRRRWTQVTAAKRLGVTQPRVSNLLRGKIHLFSIDALVEMAGRAGLRVEVTLKPES